MKFKLICLVLCILFAWPNHLPAQKKAKKTTVKTKLKKQAPEEKKILKPYVIFTGVANTKFSRSCRKITSKNEWAKLWLDNEGIAMDQGEYDYYYNTSRVPEIDFENCMVISIYEYKGERINGTPFGGFTGMEIIEEEKRFIVHLNTKTYQTIERADTLKISEPTARTVLYTFFVIPRSAKKIFLLIDGRTPEQRADKSPQIWKEYENLMQ